GERSLPLVSAAQTLQARLSSALAMGLMVVLGIAALSWYYAHALTRSTRVRESARASAVTRAQGEMPLPSLGRIVAPALRTEVTPVPAAPALMPTLAESPVSAS